jgi:hypothetical protein
MNILNQMQSPLIETTVGQVLQNEWELAKVQATLTTFIWKLNMHIILKLKLLIFFPLIYKCHKC